MRRSFLLVSAFSVIVSFQTRVLARWRQLDVGSPWQVWSVEVIGSAEFAGTFAGTYRSTNGGQSWANVNGEFTNCFIKVGSDIFAGYQYGVLKSTDDGITWTTPDSSFNQNILHMLVEDSVIYAVGSGIFKSTDDGVTWTPIEKGLQLGPVEGVVPVGSNLFAATGEGVIESTNGGNSWSTVTGTGSTNQMTNCIAAYGSTILVGWAGGIIRSTDGGNTWIFPGTDGPSYSGTVFSIVVDSAYSYIGTEKGVMLSTDRGVTWDSVGNGLPVNQVLSLAVAGTDLYATSFDRGVYASTDNGANWTHAANGIIGSSITSIGGDGSNVYIVFGNDSICSSTDNGNTWLADTGLSGAGLISGLTVIGTRVYVPTPGGIFTSSDSGKTWNRLSRSAVALVKSGTNLVAGGPQVYLSTNGGVNWSLANNSPDAVTSLVASGTYVFAAGDTGIYRSTDGGESWSEVDSSLANISSLAASGSTVVGGRWLTPYPAGAVPPPLGGLFLSADYGKTWSSYINGLPGYGIPQVSAVAIHGGDVFVGLTDSGDLYPYPSMFYSSTIHGDNWINTGQGLPLLGISSIYINDSSVFVGIGDNGGIWRAPLSQVTGVEQPEKAEVPTSILLSQNYPNPFNPTTTIDYSIARRSRVTLSVYNVLGQKVETLVDAVQQAGNHIVNFNGSRFASGVYFYQLNDGNSSITKKLMLIK